MKKIAIYGAGGFGKEVHSLINAINSVELKWNLIGYFDDGKLKGSTHNFMPILGGIDDLNNVKEEISIVFSISNPVVVKTLYNMITNCNVEFPTITAPDILFLNFSSVNLKKGNVFMFQCLVSCDVEIGEFNLFNCGVSIGHDTVIGDFNCFMSYSKLSGEVVVGDSNYFGSCCLVLQQKIIGNETVIGANSVIMRNTENKNTYLGNPAIKILKPNK